MIVAYEEIAIGYFALNCALIWIISTFTREWQRRQVRWLAISALIAISFTPSIIVFAAAPTIGPAWVTTIQQAQLTAGRPWLVGILPIVVVWGIVFLLGPSFSNAAQNKKAIGLADND